MRPGIEPTSTWILVRFVTAEPQQDSFCCFLNGNLCFTFVRLCSQALPQKLSSNVMHPSKLQASPPPKRQSPKSKLVPGMGFLFGPVLPGHWLDELPKLPPNPEAQPCPTFISLTFSHPLCNLAVAPISKSASPRSAETSLCQIQWTFLSSYLG